MLPSLDSVYFMSGVTMGDVCTQINVCEQQYSSGSFGDSHSHANQCLPQSQSKCFCLPVLPTFKIVQVHKLT